MRRLGQAAEAGQVLTRQSLASHAQAIAAAHPELDFEQVNEVLQDNFVGHPGRRGLVASDELKANIALAERAIDHLVEAETVEEALTHTVGLTVTNGVAGAGKTTAVMQAAREKWAYERHKQIWVLSRNAKTAHDLGEAVQAALGEVGADPNRVHAIPLADPSWREHIQQGDRIVVDEYALSERGDLDDLITLSTTCAVSLLGDTHQQRAIATPTAALMLGYLAEQAGQPNLADTVRCQAWRDLHDDIRAASRDEAARERALEGLDIRTVGSAAEAARIAQEEGAILLTRSNELASEASARSQHTTGPTITLRHGVEVGAGEAVVFRAIVRDERHHILGRTGDVATIVALADAHAILRHEDGRQVVVSLKAAREHLASASAQTIDSAQGRTVERAAVLLTGTEDTHALYSGATRGREAPLILVMRPTEQDEHSRAVGVDKHFDPREVVREVLSRSERATVLGLPEDDRQALLTELRERGHDDVADRLERLEADIARMAIRKQARQQEQEQERQQEQARQQEQERQQEQARQQEQERQQAQEQERQQAQEQELDINEQIRREIEERYRQLQEKLRQQRERGLGWGAEL